MTTPLVNFADPRPSLVIELRTLPETGAALIFDSLGRADVSTRGPRGQILATLATLTGDTLTPGPYDDAPPAAVEEARRWLVARYFTTHAPARYAVRKDTAE